MTKELFGKLNDGTETFLYTIENSKNMKAAITDYGAALVSLWVPDKNGTFQDVVLGYDDPISYEENSGCLGGTIGRNSNRIKDAKLTIEGIEYQLDANDNGNNLHSGLKYYHKRKWEVTAFLENKITLTYNSPHMDQGYPGNLIVDVTYEITENNGLSITYEGISDRTTIFNMTNHSYFNLSGHASGSILEQELWVDADMFTIADAESIPTGEFVPVKGTPMDFTRKKALSEEIESDYEPLKMAGGYDHNWILNTDELFGEAAQLEDKKTGIQMVVFTDCPGVQIYTGNYLVEGLKGKEGVVYGPRHGICLETQYYPDAMNHENFPQPILHAGEKRQSKTIYQFEVIK
ncbi:aldose epimerase family protein [Anaerosacchariphilus polymeriproducens]|uniref:Aldose 1-epimerase n=1 Tax=Anaerosacchariphilus polymeriproducens TaxID=1812858 RepID=A0A371ASI6_9FIRM|nr:aldose epimerase family protein [Anaerosacchariphilus polymeriproducens]RDU22521.1 galactose mutarotase [Anaerosacchariphilus polymeriproducens]